jgi:hypothetical protein
MIRYERTGCQRRPHSAPLEALDLDDAGAADVDTLGGAARRPPKLVLGAVHSSGTAGRHEWPANRVDLPFDGGSSAVNSIMTRAAGVGPDEKPARPLMGRGGSIDREHSTLRKESDDAQ